jgi:hypothetical protein
LKRRFVNRRLIRSESGRIPQSSALSSQARDVEEPRLAAAGAQALSKHNVLLLELPRRLVEAVKYHREVNLL